MSDIQTILGNVLSPSAEFTPIPFWFFNDRPDEGRIRRQLEDFCAKGVNGFVLHPRIGIPEDVPYLSEVYFRWIKYIVKTAAELDMRVVLYDEGMYPSGSAHGAVVAENPEYASKGITIRQEPAAADTVVHRFADGRLLVYGFTGGTIRGIHFGEDDGEPGAPASANILDPDAVDCFIRLTHDRYYEACGEYFGNTIIGFFTDEPCALGRNAAAYREWVPGLERELEAAGGDPEELAGLFDRQENDTTRLYHRLIKKYYREVFYARLSKWCKAHGIRLMGHPAESDDVEEELYFHTPGQDLVFRRVEPYAGGVDGRESVQAKLPADIARILGRRRNSSECFGVCNRHYPEIPYPTSEQEEEQARWGNRPVDWYLPAADLKWYVNWMGIRGVNLFIPHAFYYSVDGQRQGERPPDVGPNNIWWPYYRQMSDYMKRVCYLETDTVNGARVAVLCDNNHVPGDEIACLYRHQVEFDYVPLALLKRALRAPECRYEVLLDLLGETDAEAWTAEYRPEIRIFRRAEDVVAWADSDRGKALRTAAAAKECPDLRLATLTKKDAADVRMVLASNEGAEPLEAEILFPESHRLAEVDLWYGTWNCAEAEVQEDGFIHRQVALAPGEMRLFLSDTEGELEVHVPEKGTFLGDLTGAFEVETSLGNCISYLYGYETDEVRGDEYFTVEGEEMAECWCNRRLVGGSICSPHRFIVGPFLQRGGNEIRLVFTGSAANSYEDAGIPFGMG